MGGGVAGGWLAGPSQESLHRFGAKPAKVVVGQRVEQRPCALHCRTWHRGDTRFVPVRVPQREYLELHGPLRGRPLPQVLGNCHVPRTAHRRRIISRIQAINLGFIGIRTLGIIQDRSRHAGTVRVNPNPFVSWQTGSW